MKSKTKIISSMSAVFVLMAVLSISAVANSPTSVFMKEWGKVLKGKTNDMQSRDAYALGRNSTITKEDVEQAAEFYVLSGLDTQSAKEKAVEYVSQREALYQAAIENGYSVTDEEVLDYIEELKAIIKSADNKEDVRTVMNQFDTEEDYWEYEFTVYQKNLPIQNYVHDLEQNFMQSSVYSKDSSVQTEADWQQYFQQLKED